MDENKDVLDLINYIEEGEKRILSAKRKLIEITDDFDIWHKYCDEKANYRFLLPSNTPLMKLIDKYCDDIYERRYSVIDTNWVLEFLNSLLKEGFIDEEEFEEVKMYLYKSNFGSMEIDW